MNYRKERVQINEFVASFDSIENIEIYEDNEGILKESLQAKGSTSNRCIGVTCQICSTICFAMMTFLCKLAYQDNPHLTGFDYLLVRSSSMCFLSIMQVIYLKLNVLDIQKNDRIMLAIRCLCGGVGMPTYFYGLKYIPTSVGALIFNINPIIVAIIAFTFLQEQFTKIKIITVFGAFLGVVLFVSGKDSKDPEHSDYFFGIMCASFSCIMGSCVT